jgi:hypothetical protein
MSFLKILNVIILFSSLSSETLFQGQFEQGEYHRLFRLYSEFEPLKTGKFTNADTVELKYSPSRFSDDVSSSFNTTIAVSHPKISFLINGRGAGSAAINTLIWKNESDRLKGFARYIIKPLFALNINIDGGVQTTGWRSLGIKERRAGVFYSLDALYNAHNDSAYFSDINAKLRDARTFVSEDHSENSHASLRFTKKISEKDTVFFRGFIDRKSAEQPFSVKTGNFDHGISLDWYRSKLNYYSHKLLFTANGRSQNFENGDQNNISTSEIGLDYFSQYLRKKTRILGKFSYFSYTTSFADNREISDRPSNEQLSFANAKLGNEERHDINISTNIKYSFTGVVALILGIQKNAARFDYPFQYTGLSGTRERNRDQRDIILDNDSLMIQFPLKDTARFVIARSTRILNYLDSSRSQQNRASNNYLMRLEHTTRDGRAIGTFTRVSLSVNDDSLFFPLTPQTQGRFTRRRALYSFSDFNKVPGFREACDTVGMEINLAFQEEGELDRISGRKFVRKKAAEEALLSFRLIKDFVSGIQLYNSITFSRYRLFSEAGSVISENGLDRLFRTLFDIPTEMKAADLSTNIDWSAGGTWYRRNTRLSLSVSSRIADYNKTRIRDYIGLTLNGAVTF